MSVLSEKRRCPTCLDGSLEIFLHVGSAPAHSMLLMTSQREASNFPYGEIDLAVCAGCGFITNISFDLSLKAYSGTYEASQAYSPTFQSFHKYLADQIATKFSLRGKKVLEIGCGNGEFLNLLCQTGQSTGVGYDPAYIEEPTAQRKEGLTRFVSAEYSANACSAGFDLVCCKMTLEHIEAPNAFVQAARLALEGGVEGGVFFMVPDAEGIFASGAFWDIYYEHCSYFTEFSLKTLFSRAGFRSVKVTRAYGGQYLCASAWLARRKRKEGTAFRSSCLTPKTLISCAELFAKQVKAWRTRIGEEAVAGRRLTIWGGGSKAVAFTTQLGVANEIPYVVDVNPRRQGTFLPGTGQEVVAPQMLRRLRPDLVIVMNSIYEQEIRQALSELDIEPEVLCVGALPPSYQLRPSTTRRGDLVRE